MYSQRFMYYLIVVCLLFSLFIAHTGGRPLNARGVYFATDASNSARDSVSAPDGNKMKRMYRAKVVTGHYFKGERGIRSPLERINGIYYDSAVNCLTSPTEFVIFHDAQAYPDYCIEFTI